LAITVRREERGPEGGLLELELGEVERRRVGKKVLQARDSRKGLARESMKSKRKRWERGEGIGGGDK